MAVGALEMSAKPADLQEAVIGPNLELQAWENQPCSRPACPRLPFPSRPAPFLSPLPSFLCRLGRDLRTLLGGREGALVGGRGPSSSEYDSPRPQNSFWTQARPGPGRGSEGRLAEAIFTSCLHCWSPHLTSCCIV